MATESLESTACRGTMKESTSDRPEMIKTTNDLFMPKLLRTMARLAVCLAVRVFVRGLSQGESVAEDTAVCVISASVCRQQRSHVCFHNKLSLQRLTSGAAPPQLTGLRWGRMGFFGGGGFNKWQQRKTRRISDTFAKTTVACLGVFSRKRG